MYIEKMEDLADKTIMFLRPRKFGKTLFTSTLIPEKLNLNTQYLFLFGVGFFPIYVFPNNSSNLSEKKRNNRCKEREVRNETIAKRN